MLSAAMGVHSANDVAHELSIMSAADQLPAYMLNLTLERLQTNVDRLMSDIADVRGALGEVAGNGQRL